MKISAYFLLFSFLCAVPCGAQESDAPDPVESGRQSLGRWTVYPWYDSSTDGLKPVDIPAPKPPPSGNSSSGTFMQWFAWSMLAVILCVLAYFALRFLLQSEIRPPSIQAKEPERKFADRIESLPFPVAVGEINLLDEARRLYQSGDYAKAIVYLFSYQLVELDKRHIIRLAKGKTNRRYLLEVGSRRALRQLLEQTMISFEDAFFGRHPLEKERFEASWFQVGTFDKLGEEEQKTISTAQPTIITPANDGHGKYRRDR